MHGQQNIKIYNSLLCLEDKEEVKALYSSIKSTNSPTFCTTTFSTSPKNLTTLLPQSHDSSCYVRRPVLPPAPLWLQRDCDLRAHDFTHPPVLWHQPSSLKLPAHETEAFVEFILLYSCRRRDRKKMRLEHQIPRNQRLDRYFQARRHDPDCRKSKAAGAFKNAVACCNSCYKEEM